MGAAMWKRFGRNTAEVPESMWSLKELRVEFDRRSRRLLGISGDEFTKRAREGDLPDTPAVDHLKFLLDAVTKS